MNHTKNTAHIPAHIPAELARNLKECRVTQSALTQGFSLQSLTAANTRCCLIKANQRRQVFFLQTLSGEYFLKISTLTRTKDRLRHLLLPRRREAEWRNLHRLKSKRVAAATPVMKGHKKKQFFFLVTQRVFGKQPTYESLADAKAVGHYLRHIHDKGVYHADLHPGNIILQAGRRPCLIDAQEVFSLPYMPRWIRIHNLGGLFHHLSDLGATDDWLKVLLVAYNKGLSKSIDRSAVFKHHEYHRQRRYASRVKRCCKNSSEFTVVKERGMRGYKRREFSWGRQEIHEALDKGQWLKQDRVLQYRGTCIKVHTSRLFHKDRCLKAWKMARALEVRGIPVPKALAYFRIADKSYFLSEFLVDGIRLNDYLSSIDSESQKRQALRVFAGWIRKIHEHRTWQRDFKSTNVRWQKGSYFMLDQESITVLRRLPSSRQKIINLAQLNASLSNAVTLKDRLRFFHYYMNGRPLSRATRRKIYHEVWTITETKQTSFFGLDTKKLGFEYNAPSSS